MSYNVNAIAELPEDSIKKIPFNNVIPFSSVQNKTKNEVENVLLGDKITSKDAETIVSWVVGENTEVEKHMVDITVEELMETENYYLLKEKGELIGYSKLSDVWDWYFERGTTIVKPTHRGQGYGKKLIAGMMEKFPHLKMYSVTNAKVAMKINDGLSTQVPKEDLKPEVLSYIEELEPLLKNDHIYGNDTFLKHALK